MNDTSPKGSIIVVDDEDTVRNVISRGLEAEGYEVVTACNGREALEIAALNTFDAMFLDIMMPGMNGQDIMTMMAFAHPATKVIMLSALPDAESEAKARGAFAYLRKPASLSEISNAARKAIVTKRTEWPDFASPDTDT